MSSAAIRILVVDRDPKYREWLRLHLGIMYPDAMVSTLAPEELESRSGIDASRACDALILAADFGSGPDEPQSDGMTLLYRLEPREPAPIVVLAERGDELTAVSAIRAGAADYLPKRLLNPERLRSSLEAVLKGAERAVRASGEPPGGERPQGDGSPGGERAESAGAPPAAAAEIAQRDRAHDRAQIGEYAVKRKIGESEKAVVYLAESGRLGTDVALKVSKIPAEGRARQALEREYQAILSVHDPAVVRIFDHGIEGGYEYLAMEYFPLGDLKARMQIGVTEPEALRLLEKIATALSVVHRAGLLHRDLKPPNVMLRDADNVVLIDFGLARLLEGTHNSTYTGVLRGSPYYMSPEQALGEQLDPRSDLYSLGVIFHEMLTGRKPFTGASAMEVLQQHVNCAPPNLPPSLSRYSTLMTRLLAKKREQRFGSAAEVIAACHSLGRARWSRRAQSAA